MRNLFLFLSLFSIATSLFARKPAVEDFVGVESESYFDVPKGTEVIFNFNKHIEKLKQNENKVSNTFIAFSIFAFICLPFFMWFMISGQKSNNNLIKTNENTSIKNVTNLDDFRKDVKEESHKEAS